MTSKDQRWWGNPIVAAIGIALVCLLSQALTLRTQFCYDDFTWLKVAKSWHLGQASVFGPNPWNTFRPGTHVLWYIDYALFADRAVGYHAISLLMYAVNGVAIFALIRRLAGKTAAAFLGALLFAAGTGATECVQSSACQGFLAAGILGAWTITLADKYLSSGKVALLVGSGLACAAAMFSHEQAVVVPAALVLYAVIFARRKSMRRFGAILAAAIIACGLWGTAYLGFYQHKGQQVLEAGEPSLLTTHHIPDNMAKALPTLFIPDVHSAALRGKLTEAAPGLVHPLDVISYGLGILIFLAAVLAVLKGPPEVKLGALWCMGGMLIGSLSDLGFMGRYLYLPMVGMAVALGTPLAKVLSRGRKWAKGTVAMALALLVLANVGTSAIGAIFRVRIARERYAIISQLRQFHAESPDMTPIYVIGLPIKLKDVVDACSFYGFEVVRGSAQAYPPNAARFRYVPGGVEQEL